jgi:hypothetical protein
MAECAWERKKPDAALTLDAIAALEVYAISQTQWRPGSVGFTGLDYVAVARAVEWADLEISPRIFELVRLLEAKRLSLWNEERTEALKKTKAPGK